MLLRVKNVDLDGAIYIYKGKLANKLCINQFHPCNQHLSLIPTKKMRMILILVQIDRSLQEKKSQNHKMRQKSKVKLKIQKN
jgi:hypothetical protein